VPPGSRPARAATERLPEGGGLNTGASLGRVDKTAVAQLPKPLLRGWTHLVSFPLMASLGAAMVLWAQVPLSGRLLLSAYVGGTAVMFGVSALYHRVPWQPSARALMQKFDHSAIFLAIAGGYTPVAAVCLDGWWRTGVLLTAWLGAGVGIILHWLPRVPRVVKGASYIVISWTAVLTFPQMVSRLGGVGFALILAGGVCYTIGAACLAANWPNPWPRVFGFHEVFHAFTVVAAGLHFAGIGYAVVPLL